MKSQKYEQALVKGLANFCEACDKLANIAANNEILDKDVKYAQAVTRDRLNELKKQLEHKTVKIEIALPSSEEKSETSKTETQSSSFGSSTSSSI